MRKQVRKTRRNSLDPCDMVLVNPSDSTTPYDDAFRTLLTYCPQLVLPLLNEIFGTDYRGDERIERSDNEQFTIGSGGRESKQITDSTFIVHGSLPLRYHLECQSTEDGTIIIRMMQYDFHIALKDSYDDNGTLVVPLPLSAVLYLRGSGNKSETMTVRIESEDQSREHRVRVIRLGSYDLQTIFDKELLFLIPFYLFRYENQFPAMNPAEENIENEGEAALAKLFEDYRQIGAFLKKKESVMELTTYEKWVIIEMTKKVAGALCRKYERIRKGVNQIMGGNVIELEVTKIWNNAVKQGMAQGIKQGIEQGINQGIDIGEKRAQETNIKTLMETMHLTAQQAMDALKIPAEKRGQYNLN